MSTDEHRPESTNSSQRIQRTHHYVKDATFLMLRRPTQAFLSSRATSQLNGRLPALCTNSYYMHFPQLAPLLVAVHQKFSQRTDGVQRPTNPWPTGTGHKDPRRDRDAGRDYARPFGNTRPNISPHTGPTTLTVQPGETTRTRTAGTSLGNRLRPPAVRCEEQLPLELRRSRDNASLAYPLCDRG